LPVTVLEHVDRAPDRHPRDVHHDVHRAMRLVDRTAEVTNGIEIADVDRSVQRHLAAAGPNLEGSPLECLAVDVGEEHDRASLGGRTRGGAPDAARGSGDEALLFSESRAGHRAPST